MRKFIFALFLCLVFYQTQSQDLKTLKIGDTLPLINVQIVNGDQIDIRPLSSFYTNTFLILDFWASWCGPCITAIAEADSVARKFNGLVSVLPITYQDTRAVRKFVKNNSILNKLDLNYVTNDTVLMGNQIKFKVLPHEVWIDTNGVIKAITYPDDLTSENIQKFITNDSFSFMEKVDELDFDVKQPLNIESNNILYRSILSPYKSGLSNMMGSFSLPYEKDEGIKRFFATNKDILSLFYAAYSHNRGKIYRNRIELDVIDSLSLSPLYNRKNVSRQTIVKNGFCFELIFPQKISPDNFYSYLLQDLNRLFPFQATIEKRERNCWIIVNSNKNKNPISFSSVPKLVWSEGFIKRMECQTMAVLTSYLNWNMNYPVIDETFYTELFDMVLDISAISEEGEVGFNIEKVKNSLRNYGFDIVKGVRLVDILVIREKIKY